MSNQAVAIFDLDDTLADTRSMRDGVQRPIDEQMRRMSTAPALPLRDEALRLIGAGVRILIMTARTDTDYTREQVARYGIDADFLFRPAGNNRDDHHVKAAHVEALLAQGVNIIGAWDDKPKNVAMFASFGIPAHQA